MFVRIAFWNLRSRRLRNGMTILSVMLAIGLLTVGFAVRHTLSGARSVIASWHRILTLPRIRSNPMKRTQKREIAAIPGVTLPIDFFVMLGHTADERYSFSVIGTDDGWPEAAGDWFELTTDERDGWRRQRDGLIVAAQTAHALNLHVGEKAVLETSSGKIPCTVVGISMRGYDNDTAVLHYDYVEQVVKHSGTVTTRTIDVQTDEQIPATIQAIDQLERAAGTPTRSFPFAAFYQSQVATAEAIPRLLQIVGLVVLLITLLITANTIAISARERLHEMATLRAIGFRRGTIFRVTITEAILLCGVGGVLGAGIPLVLFRSGLSIGDAFPVVQVDLRAALVGLGAAVAMAVAASLIPALRASRTAVTVGMRQAI